MTGRNNLLILATSKTNCTFQDTYITSRLIYSWIYIYIYINYYSNNNKKKQLVKKIKTLHIQNLYYLCHGRTNASAQWNNSFSLTFTLRIVPINNQTGKSLFEFEQVRKKGETNLEGSLLEGKFNTCCSHKVSTQVPYVKKCEVKFFAKSRRKEFLQDCLDTNYNGTLK